VRDGNKLLLKHRYTRADTYTVKVTVTDDDGGVGTRALRCKR